MKSFGLVILLILTTFGAMQLKGAIQLKSSMQTDPVSVQTLPGNDSLSSESFSDTLIPPVDANHLESGQFDFSHDATALFHGHGDQVCASGCSLSRHPTEQLTLTTYRDLLKKCSAEALDADNLAFETLLFFGRQTTNLINELGTSPLSKSQSTKLIRELQRQHAQVSIRVVDSEGIRRSWTNDVRVPLDRRHVFAMETSGVQSLVTSGTIKRVGLDHLWTRL